MKDQDLYKQFCDTIKLDIDAKREERDLMRDDQKFAAGEQWPEMIAKAREAQGRPIQTINRLPAFIDQIVGDARQNKPSIKVHAGEDGDEDIAAIYDGLIRATQNESNADFAKKGQKINSGEPLAIFESHFDEEEANKLLDRLGTEFKQTISKMGKNSIKSKYTGEIVDVVLTYNRDIEEYSPSLQKLIKSYKTGIEAKKKLVAKDVGGKAESSGIEFPHTDKTTATAGKLRGLDGIMIEFTIKYKDDMFIGDKVTYSAAVKTIVADVVEEEDAPYCEGDENTKIQAVFSPLSVVSRLTEDVS